MVLSVCIPTYNRGNLALQLVKELMEICRIYPGRIEIVISNNGSDKYLDDYKTIHEIADKNENIIYFESDNNKQFVGNFNQVLRLANGEWCLLLSDEDHIIVEELGYYLDFINNNPQVGVIRANTDRLYCQIQKEDYRGAGLSAIDGYFLQGNYISGVFYNRKYLPNEAIDKMEKTYLIKDNNRGYFSYPHMFVEALLLIVSDFYRCERMLIREGDEVKDQVMDNSLGVQFFAAFEERLQQAKGYIEFVSKTKCDIDIKKLMIRKTIEKTIFLVRMQKNNYETIGCSFKEIMTIVAEELKTYLLTIDMPDLNADRNGFFEHIDMVKEYYLT